MPNRRSRAEAGFEAAEPLRRQGNFRQQHQCLTPGIKGRCDRFKIDFRFAGARHPVEHAGVEPGGSNLIAEYRRRSRLRLGEGGAGTHRVGLLEGRAVRHRHGFQCTGIG